MDYYMAKFIYFLMCCFWFLSSSVNALEEIEETSCDFKSNIVNKCYVKAPPEWIDVLVRLFNEKLSSIGNGFILQGYCASKDTDQKIYDTIQDMEPKDCFRFYNDEMENGCSILDEEESTVEMTYYLIQKDNFQKIVGAVVLYLHFEEKKSCVISGINVDEEHRKNGLGTTLLHFAVCASVLNGINEITLQSTEIAKKLYQSNGFQKLNNSEYHLYLTWNLNESTFNTMLQRNLPSIAQINLPKKFSYINSMTEKLFDAH